MALDTATVIAAYAVPVKGLYEIGEMPHPCLSEDI